jgi:hypothetical protein
VFLYPSKNKNAPSQNLLQSVPLSLKKQKCSITKSLAECFFIPQKQKCSNAKFLAECSFFQYKPAAERIFVIHFGSATKGKAKADGFFPLSPRSESLR